MNGPVNPAATPLDWLTLMNKPAVYIDSTRLAICFDGCIHIGLCERLRQASRLQDRLSAIISDFYALAQPIGPEAVSPLDQRVALLPVALVSNLVRRAGAIYWANAIANMVRAEEVRWLRETLGDALYAFALANRDLSGLPGRLEPASGSDAQITEGGLHCLGAWCHAQPAAVGERVRLKGPVNPALDGDAQSPFDDIGPAIIRCAAS